MTSPNRSRPVPEEMIGEGYIKNTPALLSTWAQVEKEFAVDERGHLVDLCFLLLKPDLLAAGKGSALFDSLLRQGIRPVAAWACLDSSVRHFEELYKFNLTVNNDQCMLSTWWLHNMPYGMGPTIGLLVTASREDRGDATVADYVARAKGPSNPFAARSGQIRFDLVSTNMALNLLHSSDDPISSVRETLVFGTMHTLHLAVSRLRMGSAWAGGGDATVRAEFDRAIMISGHARHDLDLVSTLLRLGLRIDSAANVSRTTETAALELLNAEGDALERWKRYQHLNSLEYRGAREKSMTGELGTLRERLLHPDSYDHQFALSLVASMRAHSLPVSPWEQVVLETSMFFRSQLPAITPGGKE